MGTASARSPGFETLIVEDEYLVAMELVHVLEQSGFAVLGPAPTISAALAALENQAPSACILDVNLRGEISGPVARKLRDLNIPFVVSSGYKQQTIDQLIDFDGAQNIGKPANPAQLVAALKAVLISRRPFWALEECPQNPSAYASHHYWGRCSLKARARRFAYDGSTVPALSGSDRAEEE